MSERSELMTEATDLGIKFPKNIKTTTLQAMVAESKGEPIPVEEVAPPGPAVKAEKPKTDEPKKLSPFEAQRKRIKEAKAKALATRVVTITNRDNRENDVMTTAYLSFENQHFGLSKLVPLDVPVELEQGLINVAESTNITLHKDEIVGGARTGNKVPVTVKKFAISYGK